MQFETRMSERTQQVTVNGLLHFPAAFGSRLLFYIDRIRQLQAKYLLLKTIQNLLLSFCITESQSLCSKLPFSYS